MLRIRWLGIRLALTCAVLLVSLSACAPKTMDEITGTADEVTSTVEITTSSTATVTPLATDDENDDESSPGEVVDDAEIERPAGWSEETHSNDVDPNYDVVFSQDHVHEMLITIDPEDWQAMQIDLAEHFSSSSGGRDNRQPGGTSSENPMWVEATITYDGDTWTNVGVRYKGNSSLKSGSRGGVDKLPLKMDFDEFEDDYPEIDDQRFYGFKQLSFANGYKDTSLMRDAIASQIYEDAGLPVANVAFYQISVDYGEGPVVLGLYSTIEVVDDTVIERYFGTDDGNIYEGEGTAASFAASTYNQIENSFEKENNEDEADWSDIEELFDVLHSDLRTTDPTAWRTELEAHFDVDAFLEWLAISAVIEHWDAYGSMSHNYNLYNNPETGQLSWITWDHNETLASRSSSDGRSPGGGRGVTLDKNDVGDNWPLIRYLLDEPIYYEKYIGYLEETLAGSFDADTLAATVTEFADMIRPYAIEDVGAQQFDAAIEQLVQYAYDRTEAVEAFLATQ